MAADLMRKYVNCSVILCYRSAVNHPFLVCTIIVLFLFYRLFPLLFSVLVSVSPVIVSTFVLLGTLLSFGSPNIPEIEPESKSDHEQIRNHKLENEVDTETEVIGRDGNSGFQESCRDDIELRFEEERVLDDEKLILGSRYTPLKQSESGDRLWQGNSDPVNSDPNLLWKRVEGSNEDDDEGSGSDSGDAGSDSGDEGSDMAESSSPDASMADIIPMLDELHPLLSEEQESREVVHGIDDVSEHSVESESNEDNGGNDHHENDEDEDEEDEDDNGGNDNRENDEDDKEDEIRAAIRWTEYDQKNLMNLGTSEMERNRRLENLILRRRARKTMGIQAEKNLIDLESVDIPFNIPPISTVRNNPFDYDVNDNIPGSAPSIMLQRRNPFDLPYDSSEEKPDLVGDTFQQEFAVVQNVQPFFRRHESFNVGPSVFGASRSERAESKMRPYFVPERSFAEFQRQFSGLSDSKLSSVPDTESVSSVGDVENKDNVEEDEQILEEKLVSESNVRPYFLPLPEQVASNETSFSSFERQLSQVSDSKASSVPDTESVSSDHENKDQILETELVSEKDPENDRRPYFLPEQVNSNETSFSSFQRQLSQVSDSKASSVPDTESVTSDNENKHQILETELVSEKDPENDRRPYFLPEQVVSDETSFPSFQRQLSEVSDSKVSSAHDSQSVSSAGDLENKDLIDLSTQTDLISFEDHEHDSEIRDRVFEHVDNVEDGDAIRINLGEGELHRSMSSGSSSDSVSEQIYNAKESVEVITPVSETSDYFVDGVNSIETSGIDITGLVVEENHPKEPVYDISPRSVTRNLSSSSILNDLCTNESFQHTENENQPSSSAADSSQNELTTVLNNEEHLLAGASFQIEQVEIPSNSDERSHEGILQEEVISQSQDAESSFDRSLNATSADNLEELQGCEELEQGQVASSYDEPQFSEVVELEGIPLVRIASSYENPSEELQVQITSHNSDNLPMQEHENNVSLNINSVSSTEPDVIEVLDIESKAPESPTYASDNFSIENNYVFDNIDDADEIDEDLLAELDAVGDFGVSDLESTLNEIQEDPHALEHDLLNRPAVDEDSYSGSLESIMNEMKEEPLVSENDLETNHSVDEDSYSRDLGSSFDEMITPEAHGLENSIVNERFEDEVSDSKELGSTLNEMMQESSGLEHDIESKLPEVEDSKDLITDFDEMKQDSRASNDGLETKHSGDEDSYSKDLGEMKRDPHTSEHDLETKLSGDAGSYSKNLISTLEEIKQDPLDTDNDLETNHSVDEDSYSKDLGSTLDEIKQDQHESDHDLETNRSVDEDSFSKDLESAFTEMKQDQHESDHDLETKREEDEDSLSSDLGLALDDMKQDPDVREHDLEIKPAEDEIKQDPDVSDHVLEIKRAENEDYFPDDLGLPLDKMKQDHELETKLSGDEDSYSKDLESTFNDIRHFQQVSDHRLETFYSVDENFYSKHVEQAQQATNQDLETKRSCDEIETTIEIDAEERKTQNENKTSNTQVAGGSEDGANEVELTQQAESTTSLASSAGATTVNHGTENESTASNTEKV